MDLYRDLDRVVVLHGLVEARSSEIRVRAQQEALVAGIAQRYLGVVGGVEGVILGLGSYVQGARHDAQKGRVQQVS